MATNPQDEKRDQIVRYLYERHRTSRGIAKIPAGIQEVQREMKLRHELKQADVSSNLDYLVQSGWVREDVRERSFQTERGMKVSKEQIKYKISDVGINHLEAGTMFRKPETAQSINITNVRGVTVVGDGNIVNTQFTDLARALDDLDHAIATCRDLNDEQKLDAAGDLSTIRTQIAKKNPNASVVKLAWQSLETVATLSGVADAASKVALLLAPLLS